MGLTCYVRSLVRDCDEVRAIAARLREFTFSIDMPEDELYVSLVEDPEKGGTRLTAYLECDSCVDVEGADELFDSLAPYLLETVEVSWSDEYDVEYESYFIGPASEEARSAQTFAEIEQSSAP